MRIIKETKKIYLEGKREFSFITHVLRITNNFGNYLHLCLGGSSHQSMLHKVDNDNFNGEKILMIDDSNRAQGQIPLIRNNLKLLDFAQNKNIKLVISRNQFEDEIIDFIGIPQIKNKSSKESVDLYLKDKGLTFKEFLENKVKDKMYIKNNLEKIKNECLRGLLVEILNSYSKNEYK